jgi:acetoin utilization deacetylase AcuC-like enzyme
LARLSWAEEGILRAGLGPWVDRSVERDAAHGDIERVHASELLDRLDAIDRAGGGVLDPETVVSRGSWPAAKRAAGLTIEAVERALAGDPTFALVRPPGHHATRDRSQGFCLVNNAAVAAASVLARGLARRIAILDPDVHHGNGTQDIFWRRADVLYLSTHNFPWYPGTGTVEEVGAGAGEGFTVNCPLPPDASEATWRRMVSEIQIPVVRAFAPDAILVSAGFDAHHRDPLGALHLTGDSYAWLASELLGVAPKVAAVLEGGYDAVGLAEGAGSFAAALARLPSPRAEAHTGGVDHPAAVEAARAGAKRYWRIA